MFLENTNLKTLRKKLTTKLNIFAVTDKFWYVWETILDVLFWL